MRRFGALLAVAALVMGAAPPGAATAELESLEASNIEPPVSLLVEVWSSLPNQTAPT